MYYAGNAIKYGLMRSKDARMIRLEYISLKILCFIGFWEIPVRDKK